MATTTVHARRRKALANRYANENYGAKTTIGPRQVSVIYDIFTCNKNGVPCGVDHLKDRHPAIENVIVTLLGRKLIKCSRGRGRRFEVTARGFEIGMMVDRSKLAPGLGFVAMGAPMLRQ